MHAYDPWLKSPCFPCLERTLLLESLQCALHVLQTGSFSPFFHLLIMLSGFALRETPFCSLQRHHLSCQRRPQLRAAPALDHSVMEAKTFLIIQVFTLGLQSRSSIWCNGASQYDLNGTLQDVDHFSLDEFHNLDVGHVLPQCLLLLKCFHSLYFI